MLPFMRQRNYVVKYYDLNLSDIKIVFIFSIYKRDSASENIFLRKFIPELGDNDKYSREGLSCNIYINQ